MQILVINLARANERRRKMQDQLASCGLEYEILEATDGRLLMAEDRAFVDHERRKGITPYPLSDLEIGCAISHRRAMHALIENGSSMATILEDDVQLTPTFAPVLKAIEDQNPEFDFIFLGRKFRKNEIFVPCHLLIPDLKLGRVGYTHMGAIGYIVSQKGARKFFDYAPRIIHAVDKEIHRFWANNFDLYGLEKPVVVHADSGRSYININETQYKTYPQLRPRYADANNLYWRARRRFTQAADSIRKRMAFPEYTLKAMAYFAPPVESVPLKLNPLMASVVRAMRAWPTGLRKCAENFYVLYCVAKDRKIPIHRRIPALLGVGYCFNPIDLIPDNIPVFGYMDDVAIIALGVWISVRLVPLDTIFQYRRLATQLFEMTT